MPQFRLSPDVLYRDLEGQAVILDLSSGLYFGLNEVGTRIWTLIGEGRTVADIAQILSHEYAADASSIAPSAAHRTSPDAISSPLAARMLVE